MDGEGVTLKVAGESRPSSVAGAICAGLRVRGQCEMQAIGAAAVNQAVKALAVARAFLEAEGLQLVFVPSFLDLDVEGLERTAVRFHVRSRGEAGPLLTPDP